MKMNKMNKMNKILFFVVFMSFAFISFAIFYYFSNNNNYKKDYQNKVEDFKTKIQIIEDNISAGTYEGTEDAESTEGNIIDDERELFKMFYEGIPDTYDTNGNIIYGVEPDALKTINCLENIINSEHGTEYDILRLAKIYHYGMHKFDVNLDIAEQIYKDLIRWNVSNETLIEINEGLADIKKIRVHTWLNLPLDHDPRKTTDTTTTRTRTKTITNIANITDDNMFRHNRDRNQNQNINQNINQNQNRVGTTIDKDNKIYNDPQNTHNSQVISTIKHSLENLKKSTNNTGRSVNKFIVKEIEKYVNGMKESNKKTDALIGLKAIETNDTTLSSMDISEMDALTLVWNRINDSSKFNKEVSDNLKDTLYNELASIQEHGITVCATGRFTRIIDTLNGVDEEVFIKPSYVINEEMMITAANVREKMYELYNDKNLLEAGTSPRQKEFDDKLKENIINKLKEDYVITGILTEEKFTTQVNTWINDI